jgi:calcineurin-like phosphoesterase family protein
LVNLGHLAHYCHTNICRGVSRWTIDTSRNPDAVRDFDTLEQMNDAIVNGINNNIDRRDWLFHLGDWSFGGFEKIEEFRSKINCENIVLFLGNHDHHIMKNKHNVKRLFSSVLEKDTLEVGDVRILLSHYPLEVFFGNPLTASLHGHVHFTGDKRFTGLNQMDVGIDGSPGYRPYHIDEVLSLLESRKVL